MERIYISSICRNWFKIRICSNSISLYIYLHIPFYEVIFFTYFSSFFSRCQVFHLDKKSEMVAGVCVQNERIQLKAESCRQMFNEPLIDTYNDCRHLTSTTLHRYTSHSQCSDKKLQSETRINCDNTTKCRPPFSEMYWTQPHSLPVFLCMTLWARDTWTHIPFFSNHVRNVVRIKMRGNSRHVARNRCNEQFFVSSQTSYRMIFAYKSAIYSHMSTYMCVFSSLIFAKAAKEKNWLILVFSLSSALITVVSETFIHSAIFLFAALFI